MKKMLVRVEGPVPKNREDPGRVRVSKTRGTRCWTCGLASLTLDATHTCDLCSRKALRDAGVPYGRTTYLPEMKVNPRNGRVSRGARIPVQVGDAIDAMLDSCYTPAAHSCVLATDEMHGRATEDGIARGAVVDAAGAVWDRPQSFDTMLQRERLTS